MAAACVRGGYRVRHRDLGPAHRLWWTLLYRCRYCRARHVPGDLARLCACLPLAAHETVRRADRCRADAPVLAGLPVNPALARSRGGPRAVDLAIKRVAPGGEI